MHRGPVNSGLVTCGHHGAWVFPSLIFHGFFRSTDAFLLLSYLRNVGSCSLWEQYQTRTHICDASSGDHRENRPFHVLHLSEFLVYQNAS